MVERESGRVLAGIIFRVATRTKQSYALDVGYVVGEVREVDHPGVLPLAFLADRTESGDQFRRRQSSVIGAVPSSPLRPKQDPSRNLQIRS